ncbi:WD-40 repeat protein [Reticulomyxa filosa]|uniref:WD-40 repeat protein n=1 Tax=Reticulomyxa filosa TaxID=46433 RepID=X6N1N9_RETFI|nr:WD-40 repeat protein [Reticulomyxa filosa]|eukprot:ETO19232.1 WD-40 repeat protein [Reticulomyxa filosa]
MGNSIIKKDISRKLLIVSLFQSFIQLVVLLYFFGDEIKIIIQHWVRKLNIKLGWIHDFDKLIVNYVTFFLIQLFKEFCWTYQTYIWSIDHSTLNGGQFICSGSSDKTVRVWNINTNKLIRLFNRHSNCVYCVKFSPYHYYKNRCSVICSSSADKTIRFWDFKNNRQLQVFNGHTSAVCGIELSQFNNGRYLCSGSADNTVCIWDIETSNPLHVFNGHKKCVRCVDISPLQSNNTSNDNENNSIGVIGGNGYTICSGSFDTTIRIWDIETTKQLIAFNGHKYAVKSVKYGSNELGNICCANTILSGSNDKSIRLWDIRSGQQIQIFNGHTSDVNDVAYSPFFVKSRNGTVINSNVICSGSLDNTIRFWDIRSSKKELYVIKGGYGVLFAFGDEYISMMYSLKFIKIL